MRFIPYCLMFFLSFIILESNAQTMTDEDFKAVANDICECSSDLLDTYEEIMKYAEEGNVEAVEKKTIELEKATTDMEACIVTLEKKYPHIDGNKEYQAKAEEALNMYCPKFARILNSASSTESAPVEEEEAISEDPVEEIEVDEITQEELSDAYFDEAAVGFCNCTSKLFEIGTQVSELKGEGKEEEAIKLQASMEGEIAKMNTCVETLMKKYPDLESSEENKKRSTDALVKVCPHFFKGE